jgi:signal peptidase I
VSDPATTQPASEPSEAPPEPAAAPEPVAPLSTLPLRPARLPAALKRSKDKPPRSSTRNVVEWVAIIAVALIVAVLIKTFLFQAFYIPSGSMEPTLRPGDRVLVNKLSYDLHSIHRGDIVVFKRPPSEANDPAIKDLIKRVIGLPGDTIEERDGHVFINGNPLKESYLPSGTTTTNLPATKVLAGQYFVMGDNRGNSKDSRFIGAIAGRLIVGRAFVRVWPLSKFHIF